LATGCPGFDPAICQSYVTSAALGYVTRATTDLLRHNSMVGYGRTVHLPVMLMQGEGDSLFNINEAVANYQLLRSMGDTVKLVIQSWGHSQSSPAPGEVSYASSAKGYETLLIQRWFAKYLKRAPVSTGPTVEYFRDWVAYDHAGTAEPAYGTASGWPVGDTMHFYLSGSGALTTTRSAVTAGAQTFVNPGAGLGASYSETSGVQGMAPFSSVSPSDVPGTFASWATLPLATALDSVGIPVVRFHLATTSPAGLDPATDPVVFGKLFDVAPDGTATLVQRLVSPLRVTDEQHPVTLTLPGVVHRYPAGHRIELVLAATDLAYLGSRVPDVLTITADPAHPTALDLPVVGAGAEETGGPRATAG
jgi:ABC-2 type transport system ATP-binding protein